jgi:hypothetical protein
VQSAEEVSRLISEWRAGVAEQANRFDATRRAIDEVSVTETAVGGAIVLTVESSGIPTDLHLGDDVARMKPAAIAAEIMNCLHRAQTRLADRVGTLVAETAGDDASADAIVAPAPPAPATPPRPKPARPDDEDEDWAASPW